MKIRYFSFIAIGLLLSGCAALNGASSQWKNTPPKAYEKTIQATGSQISYKLMASPDRISTGLADHKASLEFNIILNTFNGQYSASYAGVGSVSADYEKDESGNFHFSHMKLVSSYFPDMEPYVYANVWPEARQQWINDLSSQH